MNDRFKNLLELASFSADRHDKRRQFEWKIALAFWGLIVAAILKKPEIVQDIRPWHGVVLVVLYAFTWLRGLHVANENDKRLSDYFRAQATNCLNPDYKAEKLDPPSKIPSKSFEFWLGFLRKWAMLFHVLVTAILVTLYFLVDP